MKKNVFTLLVFLQSLFLFGQVGIGTTTPRATLEISNTDNGGLLIPQYALTGSNDATTVVNPQTGALIDGTLVYNTTDVTGGNALAKGFVYWDATSSSWSEVAGAAATGGGGSTGGWELTGNNVTNGQFLGTTNFQALRLRSNNTQVALLDTGGGIAIGQNAVANNFNNGTAIGKDTNATGQNSSAFGYTATATGQNATAIGFGANAPNATTIILGNTDTNAANFNASKVGIGTNAPSAKLQVNGSFRYVDTNEAAGRILTSDGNGNATWQASPIAAPVAIYAQVYKNGTTNNIESSRPISFGTTSVSNGVNNISNNNIQTAFETGVYRITYTINLEARSGGEDIEFFITQGSQVSDKIPGSSTFISVANGSNERGSVTKSFLVDVNSPFQQFFIFPSITSDDITILEGSSFAVELAYPD